MVDIIDLLHHHLEECYPREDSQEYRAQNERTEKLYEDLRTLLNAENKEKLRRLEDEYFLLQGIEASESFIYGFKTAFKLIFQALI